MQGTSLFSLFLNNWNLLRSLSRKSLELGGMLIVTERVGWGLFSDASSIGRDQGETDRSGAEGAGEDLIGNIHM